MRARGVKYSWSRRFMPFECDLCGAKKCESSIAAIKREHLLFLLFLLFLVFGFWFFCFCFLFLVFCFCFHSVANSWWQITSYLCNFEFFSFRPLLWPPLNLNRKNAVPLRYLVVALTCAHYWIGCIFVLADAAETNRTLRPMPPELRQINSQLHTFVSNYTFICVDFVWRLLVFLLLMQLLPIVVASIRFYSSFALIAIQLEFICLWLPSLLDLLTHKQSNRRANMHMLVHIYICVCVWLCVYADCLKTCVCVCMMEWH